MTATWRFLFVGLVSICICLTAISSDKKSKDPSTTSDQLQALIKDVLSGTNLADVKSFISPDAYIVTNSSFVSLFEALNGRDPEKTFLKERNSRITFWKMTLPNDESSALIVFKTQGEEKKDTRYHSVFVLKTSEGKWQIKHWHAS